MGYANETGYVAQSIEAIIGQIRENINTQFGLTFTSENFEGTNWYKFSYALAQKIQANEVKLSEVFIYVQDYFRETNETIQNPAVTPNGIIDTLKAAGYVASVKPMIDADAGKSNICVDVDSGDPDYAAMKLEINTIIKNLTPGGIVTQGAQSSTLTLTNGQQFDYKFHLPDKHPALLRLTITTSRNNQNVIDSPEEIKTRLLENIAARYQLGKDFEPERYYTTVDAPWAGDILLEYSINDGADWDDDTYEALFDDLLTFALEDVELIEE